MFRVSFSAAWAVAAWMFLAVFHGPGVAAAEPSYYDILEVAEDASQEEIRKAYKRQALKWHPDRSRGDPTAEDRFRELAATYEVLSDPKRRKQYDLAQRGGGGEFSFDFGDFGDFAFSNPFDVFTDLFGGGDPFAELDQLFQGAGILSGFDQMFQGLDDHFQGFDQQFDQILHGAGGGGGGFFGSSFSSFSFVSGDGKVKSERVGAAHCPSSGCDARCAAVDAFSADREPRDDTVDHVTGSACCNAKPQSAATDARGCCQRCAESPECEVFVWQPSTGSCWLLRWKLGSPRVSVRSADRVMGELAEPQSQGGSARA